MPWENYRVTSRNYLRSAGVPGRPPKFPRPPRGRPEYYTDPVAVRTVDENSTAFTLSNSASETAVASLTLPANALDSTGGARLSAFGSIQNTTSAGGTVTLRVKWQDGSGTTTVAATSGIVCSTSTGGRAWELQLTSLGNATLVNTHWGYVDVSSPGTGTVRPSTYTGVANSTTALDETDQITVTVTAQLSAASSSFSLTRRSAVLEVLN